MKRGLWLLVLLGILGGCAESTVEIPRPETLAAAQQEQPAATDVMAEQETVSYEPRTMWVQRGDTRESHTFTMTPVTQPGTVAEVTVTREVDSTSVQLCSFFVPGQAPFHLSYCTVADLDFDGNDDFLIVWSGSDGYRYKAFLWDETAQEYAYCREFESLVNLAVDAKRQLVRIGTDENGITQRQFYQWQDGALVLTNACRLEARGEDSILFVEEALEDGVITTVYDGVLTAEEVNARFYENRLWRESIENSWNYCYPHRNEYEKQYASHLDRYDAYAEALHVADLPDTAWDISGDELFIRPRAAAQARLAQGSDTQTAVLLSRNNSDSDWGYQPVLAVGIDGAVSFEVVNQGCLDATLWVCDLDGDGLDEIIVHSAVGMSGGAGAYQVQIYQWKDGGLSEWWNGEVPEAFGFTVTLEDGFVSTIQHPSTGFSTSFFRRDLAEIAGELAGDTSEWFPQEYHLDGTLTGEGEGKLEMDSMYRLYPVGLGDSGRYGLVTVQYTYMWAHVGGVGDAYSLWAVDETGTLAVIQAEFQPYDYDLNSQDHAYDWEMYDRYWYRPLEHPEVKYP